MVELNNDLAIIIYTHATIVHHLAIVSFFILKRNLTYIKINKKRINKCFNWQIVLW